MRYSNPPIYPHHTLECRAVYYLIGDHSPLHITHCAQNTHHSLSQETESSENSGTSDRGLSQIRTKYNKLLYNKHNFCYQ